MTARRIAQYGVGDDLLHAAHSFASNEEALQIYIDGWACRVQKILIEDPLGHIGRHHTRYLNNFPLNFLTPSLVLAYTNPVISALSTDSNSVTLLPQTSSNALDIERLAYLCEFHFGWTQNTPPGSIRDAKTSGTLRKLQDYIWTGVCLHSMLPKVRLPTNHVLMFLSHCIRLIIQTLCIFTLSAKHHLHALSDSTESR